MLIWVKQPLLLKYSRHSKRLAEISLSKGDKNGKKYLYFGATTLLCTALSVNNL